jgi:type IV secretion system protein VirB9
MQLKRILLLGLALCTPALALAAPPQQPARPTEMTASKATPLGAVAAANRRALREPSASHFHNAAQLYAFQEGAVYRLFAAPGRVSDIALEPGETLIAVAAGDTARWLIGDTTSGNGSGRRTHILVKPTASRLRTNLVITTDRRVYLLSLESSTGPAMPAIGWSYPADELLALKRAEEAAAASAPVAAGLSHERLNFRYAIEGDRPPWRPLRVFDDGTRVFIEFPASIARGEVPPLFVTGPTGRAELTNYRVRGNFYVVDRLFSRAELRLGEKRQQVVRILREGSPRERAR